MNGYMHVRYQYSNSMTIDIGKCISREDEKQIGYDIASERERLAQGLGRTCTAERAQWALEAPAAFFPRAMQAFLL